MSNSKVARISGIASPEEGGSGPSTGPARQAAQGHKSVKRIERIKTKDDVRETGVYFNGPLLRYEAWSVTRDAKRLVGWIGIEACVAQPKCKEYWDKYVWEEYLVIGKTNPKDMLEKVLSDEPAEECKVEIVRNGPGKVA